MTPITRTACLLALWLPAGFAFAVQLVPLQAQPAPTAPGPAPAPTPTVPAAPPPPRQIAPPSPTPAPAAPAAPPSVRIRPGQVLFNFQDADVQAVVKTVSQLTGRNFLLDPRVKGKITIISAKPVSTAAAYQIFLSALKAQGFTAVAGPGGITKILPDADAKQNAPVNQTAAPKGGDQLVTQVVPVENGSALQMVPLLRPLMAPTALLTVYQPANTLVITDYADNVRRLLQIIEKLDQPGTAGVTIIPLQYASALDMALLLTRLSEAVPAQGVQPGMPAQGGEAHRVSVVPDARTNSLLVRTDNPGRLEQLRALIAKLDVPARAGGNTHVVYLRNADATKLVEVLRGLLTAEARAAAPAATGATAGAARPTEASLIQADAASNALIINASDAVYNNLRAVIEKLDMRRAQVFVEALIVEVTSDKAAEFGVQWAAGRPVDGSTVAGVQNFPLTSNGIGQIIQNPFSLGAGLSVGFLGKQITLPNGSTVTGLGALVRALESDSETNILSTPNLLTLDNAEAKIVVGQNVPFVTGQYAQTATATTTTTTVNPFQTIERRDVGLTLRIKPQISEGGTIKLLIFQEVSAVVPGTRTQAADLITTKRSIETTVLVDDGSTIVLGGLIDDNVQESMQGVPILSKIPILGELFKYRQRTKTKTNLMIFLRPVIVRGPEDSQGFTADRYEYMRTLEQQAQQVSPSVLPSYSMPVLPPLTQPQRTPAPQGKEAPPANPQGKEVAPPNSPGKEAPPANNGGATPPPSQGAAPANSGASAAPAFSPVKNASLLGPPDVPNEPSAGIDRRAP